MKTAMCKFEKNMTQDENGVIIKYKVSGFWPNDYIQVLQFKEDGLWEKPYISRQSRKREGDIDDYESELNVAAAINDALKECRRLDKRTGKN